MGIGRHGEVHGVDGDDMARMSSYPIWVSPGYSLHVVRIDNGTLAGPSPRPRQFLGRITVEVGGRAFEPRPRVPVFISDTDPTWSGNNQIFDGRDVAGDVVGYYWTASVVYSADGVAWSDLLSQDTASTPAPHTWVLFGRADSGVFRMTVSAFASLPTRSENTSMERNREDSLETYSLERHMDEWSRRTDTVVLQGVLYEEGDYYIIEINPSEPGTLLKVRKADIAHVSEPAPMDAVGSAGPRRRVTVKRGVPVVRMSIQSIDSLADSLEELRSGRKDLFAVSGVRCANGGAGTTETYQPGPKIESYRFGTPQPDSANIVIQSHRKVDDYTLEFSHDALGLCGTRYSGYIPIYIN